MSYAGTVYIFPSTQMGSNGRMEGQTPSPLFFLLTNHATVVLFFYSTVSQKQITSQYCCFRKSSFDVEEIKGRFPPTLQHLVCRSIVFFMCFPGHCLPLLLRYFIGLCGFAALCVISGIILHVSHSVSRSPAPSVDVYELGC